MKPFAPALFLAIGLTGYLCTSPSARAQARSDFSGKLDFKITGRLESVEQTSRRDASAVTFGSDLGYTISYRDNLKVSAQIENTTALDGDAYNQAGLNPGGSDRAVVADPEITELNQLWASARHDVLEGKIGRQILIYDNARFVGNVGWRQNMQTFDAARFSVAAPDSNLRFDYAYVDKVLRVLGRDHPAGQWDSNSHLTHLQWQARSDLTLTGYNYALDFNNARANSSATTGLALTGQRIWGDESATWQYRLEFAHQTDFARNPRRYEADYWCVEAGFTTNGWTFLGGYEDLGADNGVGFSTPLATAHAFNGWADLFLATPPRGLADRYGKIATTFNRIKVTAVFHDFVASDGGRSFGREIDLSAGRKLSDQFGLLLKLADFDGANGRPDVTKLWCQVVFTY